jgi:ribosomal-protein-alanine N-acetyltransferase
MSLRIDKAGAAHAAVLAALHAESIVPPWSTGTFATLLGQPGVAGWVATENEEPVGLLLARAAADEAEILTLAVLPRRRRRGIAAHLMAQLVVWAASANVTCLFLEVAEDNVAARALYERSEFAIAGRRTDYYAPGRDALLLTRELM